MVLGAEVIAKAMKSQGVKRVFVFPGGTIAPLLDALLSEGIDIFCPRNEQGAGYAAIGASKISGMTEVVMVTSGPGVTNLLTPIADAYYDSVPILAITGQVGTKDINYDRKVRQTGFQETDTVNIFKPVTKNSRIVYLEEGLGEVISEAFQSTREGRPGPVLLDLPMDVQRGELKSEPGDVHNVATAASPAPLLASRDRIRGIVESLSKSERPLILAGNGVYISRSVDLFRAFVERVGAPVITSLPAIGVLPCDHSLNFGFLGHTGEFHANLAAFYSDLLIVLGARLDLRQTGTQLDSFRESKRVIRVDIDPSELQFGRVKADVDIQSDLGTFFKIFLEEDANPPHSNHHDQWIAVIRQWKSKYDSSQFFKGPELHSRDIIRGVDELTEGRNVTSGVGAHQQFAARYFSFDYPKRIWMTSAGHGTMGFDIPANMGAVLESDKKTLGIVFVGDGSFQMNVQELATIEEFDLPMKIFVLDNNRLGIVSQFQLLNWKRDPTTGKKKNPSFAKIAEGYGLAGYDISDKTNLARSLSQVLKDDKPAVVHCHVNYEDDVLPMLLAGKELREMHPFGRVEL